MAALLLPAMAPSWAQWTSDKPPVLDPEDYPPEATQDPPDARHTPRDEAPKSSPDESSGVSQSDMPPPRSTDVQVLPAPSRGVAQPAPVQVDPLGTPEGPPVGTLTPSNGGFDEHVWSGSERGKTEDLLARAPLVSADPVLRDIVRRLVLTKAGAPPGQAKKAFITMRIEKLLDAGLIQEAGAIAAQASVPNDEEFARVQATAILYANRAQDACGQPTAARQTSGDVFWMQLRAYCATATGDTATAELTRDVLRAQGHKDPAFDALVESVLAKKPVPPGAIAQPNAVHIFLMQQAGLPVSEVVARKLGTAANVLVLRDTRNSPRDRFEAAERVVTTGAVSATELRQIADAQDLPLNRVANASLDAPKLPFFMGQVLLRRAASAEQRPEEKARLLTQALWLGDHYGTQVLAARLQSDALAAIKPSAATKPFARTLAQGLVLGRRFDAAARWTTGDPLMAAVVAIASQDATRLGTVQGDLAAFGVSLAKNPPDADPDRSYKALVLGMADVLGGALPPEAKNAASMAQSQNWSGKRPSSGQMRSLQQIAQIPERRGEALLMLTGTIRSLGLREMAPDAAIEFVRLLAEMNETQAARNLAIQAMAQYVSPAASAPPAGMP